MYKDKLTEAQQAVIKRVHQEFTQEDLLRNIRALSEGLTSEEMYDLYEVAYIHLEVIVMKGE